MDVRFINPFVNAVQTVFKVSMNADTFIGKPFVSSEDDIHKADISAAIGLSGDVIQGRVILSFSKKSAIAIARQFSNLKMDMKHPDLHDALGELLNMIAGQAKSHFENVSCQISLPRVFTGKELEALKSKEPVLVLPCDSTLGRFRVEVSMHINTSHNSQMDLFFSDVPSRIASNDLPDIAGGKLVF